MTFLEKAQSLVILAAVGVGLALGHIPAVAATAGDWILPLLMSMLAGVFLQVRVRDCGRALRFRGVAVASLVVNFAWTPLFAWGLGWLFLGDQPALWVGFLMLAVTPCTDWYLVFTGISKGNLPLSTTLLPVNLVLQLLLLPLYLAVLAGAVIPINWPLIFQGIGLVLVLPFLVAAGLRHAIVRFRSEDWLDRRLLPPVQRSQTILLALAIAAVFASEGEAIAQKPRMLLLLLPPLLLFFGGNFALAFLVGKWLRTSFENFVSLSYLTLARNSPSLWPSRWRLFPPSRWWPSPS